jgi:GNAT superfamily N-acetyltransferase
MADILRLGRATPDALYEEIAQLHIDTIHHGALPLLGKKFMARLYRDLTLAKDTGLWVALEDGRLLGFICGCADLGRAYTDVLKQADFLLFWHGLRACLDVRILRKVAALFFYPFHSRQSAGDSQPSSPAEQKAQLLAISVNPHLQQKGIGSQLVAVLEKSLLEWGVSTYTVTTNIEEIGSNAFYRKNGFHHCGTLRHHALILQMYQKVPGIRPEPERTG